MGALSVWSSADDGNMLHLFTLHVTIFTIHAGYWTDKADTYDKTHINRSTWSLLDLSNLLVINMYTK